MLLPTSGAPAPSGHRPTLALLVAALGLAACDSSTPDAPLAPTAAPSHSLAAAQATPTVFATGLRFPRGLTFGPDGRLYVAEAGSGGTISTRPSACDQVDPPVGPYQSGRTARISRIGPNGNRSTVAFGFPSGINALGDVIGVADVAFLDGQLYALVAGGGCSHGSRNVPAGIAKVSSTGDWSIVADLSAYLAAHPVANPPADFEPDGTWYSMLAVRGKLFAVEPNHGEVARILPDNWRVSRVVDVSATRGHIVPTALAQRSGALFFGNLGVFPVELGTEKVFQLAGDGSLTLVKGGFTTVLGLDFDAQRRMYVLETSHAPGFPTPGAGRVVRLNLDGSRDVIVDGLTFPTAMRFGPDGRLYISNKGYGPPQPGEILRVDVPGVTPEAIATN
ncbi:MAG TPA: ScyD/ScyE family protein [Gemmatimonadales bacterium]|nr:ScyD/ScyE family protein [Gemmatimonadales bacterium]